MNIEKIQQALEQHQSDGWLFFDHHHRDPLAYSILGLDPTMHVSRRWYYFIPRAGSPRKLVHRIESGKLDSLPGEKRAYSSWQEQASELRTLISGSRRISMQYSPLCAIPYVATVDAGTVELVRSCGVEVTTSADLVQLFEATLSKEAVSSHFEAGKLVDRIRAEAFELIRSRTRSKAAIKEEEVKDFILARFASEGLFTDHGPAVAVNGNASNPHYDPKSGDSSEIRSGDFVLIDLWAKFNRPGAIYYDITWTGFCGDSIPEEIVNVFEIVRGARDAAVSRVRDAFAAGRTIRGFEIDDAAREYIKKRGHAEHFFHRTGHSIGENVHGNGANIDNLESHDERTILPWTCFSIEPGIYLPRFGIRSEVNVLVDDTGARTTGEVQQALVTI